jgi:hypothetical protein
MMEFVAPILSGSKAVTSAASRRFIVPPYCGAPSLSHQFPDAAVVVEVIGVTVVLVVEDVFDVVQDTSRIAVTTRKFKPNPKNLFFKFLL